MFASRNIKALLLLAAPLLFSNPNADAQSGRNPPTPRAVPGMQPAPTPTPVDHTRYEKVRVVVARGREEFVKALNEQGRLGYRLEKTVGYGGPDPQRYAAVLHLDPGHRWEATAYAFLDDRKHRSEFDRTVAAGNRYAGLLVGDPTCDSDSRLNDQKLVFAGGASPGEYKILEIPDRGPDQKRLTGLLPDASVSELQRLLAEGFRVRDLFYTYGLYAILEKQTTEAHDSQTRVSER